MEVRVGEVYRIGKKIGAGSFGEIYVGVNTLTNEEVAIKKEKANVKHPQIPYEAKIYRILQNGGGIPKIHWQGTEGEYNYLVLELLGPNLEELFNFCNRKFSLKTVLMVADQMISRIEYMHSKGFLHRDIKPENFLIGVEKTQNIVYTIDYGLSKRYKDPHTGMHIPFREGKNLTGTARYASINCHKGFETSRRDDLEAIGYVFVYFLKGKLPWQGLRGSGRKGKYEAIMNNKITTPLETLCQGIPEEFGAYIEYCRNLKFEDRPNYEYLKNLFRDLYFKHYEKWDMEYDWLLPEKIKAHRIQKENENLRGNIDELTKFQNEKQATVKQEMTMPQKVQQQEPVTKQNENIANLNIINKIQLNPTRALTQAMGNSPLNLQKITSAPISSEQQYKGNPTQGGTFQKNGLIVLQPANTDLIQDRSPMRDPTPTRVNGMQGQQKGMNGYGDENPNDRSYYSNLINQTMDRGRPPTPNKIRVQTQINIGSEKIYDPTIGRRNTTNLVNAGRLAATGNTIVMTNNTRETSFSPNKYPIEQYPRKFSKASDQSNGKYSGNSRGELTGTNNTAYSDKNQLGDPFANQMQYQQNKNYNYGMNQGPNPYNRVQNNTNNQYHPEQYYPGKNNDPYAGYNYQKQVESKPLNAPIKPSILKNAGGANYYNGNPSQNVMNNQGGNAGRGNSQTRQQQQQPESEEDEFDDGDEDEENEGAVMNNNKQLGNYSNFNRGNVPQKGAQAKIY